MGRLRIRKAFTLVELLIVVSILGILGAIVLPAFGDHIQQAKEAAAKDTLRILRNAIGMYAAQHNDVPPGYKYDNPSGLTSWLLFKQQLIDSGNYLSDMPENPFNNKTTLLVVKNSDPFPSVFTDYYGWIYKPSTKQITLDHPGTDSEGVIYTDY